MATMREDEFDGLLSAEENSAGEELEPCRLVGRFAPIQGTVTVDCKSVTFRSVPGLRQLSVHLCIPTRSIVASTTQVDLCVRPCVVQAS